MQSMNALTLAQVEAELHPPTTATPHMDATSSVCNQALLLAIQSLQQQISTMTPNLGTNGSNRGDHPGRR